jgi:hypothetical protein
MPKLYHVFDTGRDDIISSWKIHDEAVLAIGHMLNPDIISRDDPAPTHLSHFQEEEDKTGYCAASPQHPNSVQVRHSAEKGAAGESRVAYGLTWTIVSTPR